MDMPGPPSRDGSSLTNLRLAVSQKVQGVTGDQHSAWDRAANTPGEMLGVGQRWADSVGQTRDAWSNVNAPVNKGEPNERPPTTGEKAARVIRATQQTVGAVMGGLGVLKDSLDVGFANLTAPLAAIFPSLPAATLMSPYLGTPHAHPTHPPSGPPPIPPTPLPSLGMVLLGVSVRVLINNMPAARCEDIGLAPTCCGIPPAWFRIKTGSSNVFIGGARAARLMDVCKACPIIPEPPDIPAGKVMAAGKALSAAMASAQMAMDASKMAVEKTMWKDPVLPPTGSIGAIIDPSHATVLIGGFPMINIPDPVSALLNRLKRYKASTHPEGPSSNTKGPDCL